MKNYNAKIHQRRSIRLKGDDYLWQRNYYEHIIRNESSYQRISEYITNNPINWKNDEMYHP
jgi:putative transposase